MRAAGLKPLKEVSTTSVAAPGETVIGQEYPAVFKAESVAVTEFETVPGVV
jgi:hypothetical protein